MNTQRRTSLLEGCTPASIAAAKAARDFERRMVYEQTGVMVTGEGRITVPPKAVIMLCPKAGCTHKTSARNEGRVVRAMASHLVQVHGAKE